MICLGAEYAGATLFGLPVMSVSEPCTRIHCSIDLTQYGKQFGDLYLRHSDNRQPLGYYPVPVISIVGAAAEDAPTALLIGGIHGDEFEGPVSLMRLVHALSPDEITGRVIILPAVNMPAVAASSRISPLDGANMNRAFPGSPDGGPTDMLAHFVESILMPECTAVIDLHAGGKASMFTPVALAARSDDAALFAANLALAGEFGLPLIWLLGALNDDRSVNAAAGRSKVPMIAVELGGGGACDPDLVAVAESGIRRCLTHIGVLQGKHPPPGESRRVEINSPDQNLYAPCAGLFDRSFRAGEKVTAGQSAGCVFPIHEPARAPVALNFPEAGVILSHGNRPMVERGEMLALVAREVVS